MEKQYPLRIDDSIYVKARSKAVLERISMKDLITHLLEMWTDGKIQLMRRQSNNEKVARAYIKSRQ